MTTEPGMDLDKIAPPPSSDVDEHAVEVELQAYTMGEPLPLRHEPWRITNLNMADWAFRRLTDLVLRSREYDAEIALWRQAQARVAQASAWFEDRLREWAVSEREHTPSVATYRTAHGTVGTQQHKPKIVVVDEDLVIAWARTNAPAAVKVTEEFRISQLQHEATIGQCPVGWQSTNKTTGERETLPFSGSAEEVVEKLPVVQARLGDEFYVEVLYRDCVLDTEGVEVPGLGVSDGYVTASVKPLGA